MGLREIERGRERRIVRKIEMEREGYREGRERVTEGERERGREGWRKKGRRGREGR